MTERAYILDTNGILRTTRGPSGPQWGVWVEPGRGTTPAGAEVRWAKPIIAVGLPDPARSAPAGTA